MQEIKRNYISGVVTNSLSVGFCLGCSSNKSWEEYGDRKVHMTSKTLEREGGRGAESEIMS